MKSLSWIPVVFGMAGLLAGCHGAQKSVLGKAPDEGTLTLVSAVKSADASVTLHGTMIEKCPVAGCWFMLRDKSGVIKVDTKAAGFVVSNVPLNTEVTVAGKPVLTGEHRIAASGMTY